MSMKNKAALKKEIIYKSTHRGTKEMDILLGSFVEKNINNFTDLDLNDLKNLIQIEDDILNKWYFEKDSNVSVPVNNVSKMLKNFKL